jgi:hypothetical protein
MRGRCSRSRRVPGQWPAWVLAPVIVAWCLSAQAAEPKPSTPAAAGRTVSQSGQFIVFAQESAPRMETARKLDELKTGLTGMFRIPDTWKMPILVNLEAERPPRQRNPDAFSIGLFESEGDALRIQVDVFDPAFLSTPQFSLEIIRAMLLEIAYRETPIKAGKAFQLPPDWIVEAAFGRLNSNSNLVKPAVYSSLLASESPPELRDFLRLRPASLDSTSRLLYRAQAMALVDALTQLPDGAAGLQNYIRKTRRNPATIEEIISMFPSLAEDKSALGRRWLLAIAKGSATNRADLLSSRETGKELDRILEIKALPDPKNPEVAAMSGPYALESIARSRNGRFILNQLNEELLRLSLRAHPMFQPVVQDYLQIVRELIAKPKRRVDKRVASAEEIRAGLRSHNSEVESFIDWVETTKISEADETTAIAIEEADTIEDPPPRPDAISRHLDAIAERGW